MSESPGAGPGETASAPEVTITITIDAADPGALAGFWSEALGYDRAGSTAGYVALVPHERPGPTILLQRVPEPKVVKNRVHLDLKVPDIASTVARLHALGARKTSDVIEEWGSCWVVMADPEGNEFCVCDGQGGC